MAEENKSSLAYFVILQGKEKGGGMKEYLRCYY